MSVIDPPRPRANEIIGPREIRFRLGWIYLTHVNQRWRRLLLAMPQLWAKVFSVMPESALEETLSRAGDAPWHVNLDNNPHSQRYKRLMALAQSHLERVRVLCNPNMFEWSIALHDKHLPELIKLDVTQQYTESHDIIIRSPSLEDCTLRYLPAQLIAPNLRRLVMRGNPGIPSSTTQFLDTLSTLPYLEELELSLLAKEPLVWGDYQVSPVTLRRLRRVVLFGTRNSDMIGFWHRLDLPENMPDLRITYRGNVGWGPVVDTFAPYLAREAYNALAFRQGTRDLFELCAFTFDEVNMALRDPGIRHLGVSLQIVPLSDSQTEDEEDEEDSEPYMQQVLPRMLLPLKTKAENITHISFDTFNRFDMHDEFADPPYQPRVMLRDELRAFASVTSVSGRVYNFDFSILFVSDEDNWETDSDEERDDEQESQDEDGDKEFDGDSSESIALFPKLTTLTARIDESGSDASSLKKHWKELNAVLETRSQARIPIQRLIFTGSIFPISREKRQRLAVVQEKGLAQAKVFGLQEFVDRRVTRSMRVRGGQFITIST